MGSITPFPDDEKRSGPPLANEAAVRALLGQVGARVREAREARDMTRRVLAERSGVSMRYLAQLESGDGNISIGLLHRVAIALDQRLENLVGSGTVADPESQLVAALYQAADSAVRDQVRQLLDQQDNGIARAGRVCLIGLRGAGKSTLGHLAGQALGVPFVELNDEIEAIAGMPVQEIMALYGQEGYRRLEAEALNHMVATHERMILAVGGGIVAEPETYSHLLARFHSVWIKASPSEHMARVRAQGDERPMAGNPEAMEQLKSILVTREAHYEQAQTHLDTSGADRKTSLKALLALIARNGFIT